MIIKNYNEFIVDVNDLKISDVVQYECKSVNEAVKLANRYNARKSKCYYVTREENLLTICRITKEDKEASVRLSQRLPFNGIRKREYRKKIAHMRIGEVLELSFEFSHTFTQCVAKVRYMIKNIQVMHNLVYSTRVGVDVLYVIREA